MQRQNAELSSTRRFGGVSLTRWGLIYGLLILYSSTVIGPAGPNFIFLDPAEALRRFSAIRFVEHGSDQRADWIGNLLMLVPFGFLVTGAMWPSRMIPRLFAMLAALLTCFMTIVVIKYLQLFFPPRTVTLNYITAQTAGAFLGCICFPLLHARFGCAIRRGDPVTALVQALRLYLVALIVFLLMPLDFALDATDLRSQITHLPSTILVLPGPGRTMAQRLIVILVAAAAFMPVGVLLSFVKNVGYQVRRSILAVAGLGLVITTGVYVLSTLVISAFPVMPAILYRTCGIIAGAAAIRWLVRQDAILLRQRLRRLVPWAVLPYAACVLVANRLLSIHFLSLQQAVDQAYPLGFLPLFDYYIVTKAEAAKNIIGHAVLYMPIGVLLWLRCGEQCATKAFITAATVSFIAETGRYFRPGLEGDVNAVFVAGLASMLAARSMPTVWSMMQALGHHRACASAEKPDSAQPMEDRDRSSQPASEIQQA